MPDITTVSLEKLMNGASRRWRNTPAASPRLSPWTLTDAMEEERADPEQARVVASGTPAALSERGPPLGVAAVLMQIRVSHCVLGPAAV
jgi:hypothetical protein